MSQGSSSLCLSTEELYQMPYFSPALVVLTALPDQDPSFAPRRQCQQVYQKVTGLSGVHVQADQVSSRVCSPQMLVRHSS